MNPYALSVSTLHDVIGSRTLSGWSAREADYESAASAICTVNGRRGADNVDREVALCCGIHDFHSTIVLGVY